VAPSIGAGGRIGMRAFLRTAVILATAGLVSLGAAPRVSAQVCGDADASGAVTVTDGVATLRAAAGLSSACTASTCDVDGSGSITVSDGVNVLRKAAGLAITENCPGGTTGDVQEVVADTVLPFLTFGLTQVPNVSLGAASVQPAGGTEDCEDGGSRTTSQAGQTITVTFDACKVSEPDIGRFQLDGFVRVSLSFPTSTVTFELNVADLDSGRLVDFDGSVSGTPRIQGGFVIDGGPISIAESEGGPAILRLDFHDLTVDGDGHLVSGSVEAEDTGDNFDLKSAELEVEDSETATVHVVRDDDSEQDFVLNLRTGELTEAN
jgi:hypothetical protein